MRPATLCRSGAFLSPPRLVFSDIALNTDSMNTYTDTPPLPTSETLRDHFLIAMPGMHDARFNHTVTYICEHSEKGAMGIIINQLMPLTLGSIFNQLSLPDRRKLASSPVLAGGPVQVERGFVLHPTGQSWQSTLPVSDQVALTASRDIIDALAEGEGPGTFLVALGYAGWEAGQLEEEIRANAWLTVPANPAIIFDTPLDQRWTLAAQQPLGIDLNLISSVAGHA